jgi:predicted nucleic acid-binding protein
MTSAIVVADTSVLLNFLKIGRMDLIGSHPRRFLATDHVENEIIDETQRAAFLAAVASGHLDTCTVNDPREVELFLRLAPGVRLGAGECSALAVAVNRGHAIAIDDNRALNRASGTPDWGASESKSSARLTS